MSCFSSYPIPSPLGFFFCSLLLRSWADGFHRMRKLALCLKKIAEAQRNVSESSIKLLKAEMEPWVHHRDAVEDGMPSTAEALLQVRDHSRRRAFFPLVE